ncbi:hypothetical protein SCALM49S_01310 [Streptomyces californicus]
MADQRGQSRSSPGAPALHGAARNLQDLGGLRHRVTLHVDEDQGRPLLGGQRVQGLLELTVEVLSDSGALGGFVGLQKLVEPFGVVHGDVLREAALRTRSRQALTVIRWSQVVTADWPRKVWAARKALTRASWTASAASSLSPRVRNATAQSRSR